MTPERIRMRVQQAERDARALLEEVARRDPRAVQPPVDPVRMADALGIDVFTARMDPGVSGTLEKARGSDPVIYLNRVDSQNRQRFTCAHELGHYVMRTSQGELVYEFVDERAELASTGQDPEERYANRFAAALLMPEELVRQEHRRGLGRVGLALRFGVSEEAMGYRLLTLGLE